MIDQYASLSEKFLRKGFWLYLFGFIIAPLGYIIKIILSQDLSVSEVGILYGIISLVTLLSAFSDFWMRESLSYFIPRYNEKKDYDSIKSILFFAFIIQCITGGIIFLILFFGATFIADNYFESNQAIFILKVFSFFFLGINLFQLINNFFMAVQNTFLQKICEFLRMFLVMACVLWIFVLDFWDIQLYSFSWIFWLYVGIIISLIIFFTRYYTRYFKHSSILFDRQLFLKVITYSSVTFLSVQSFVILSQIDMQMVLYLLGTNDAGYYTNYLSLITIPNIIIGPIFFMLYPIFSELDAQQQGEKIRYIKALFQKHFLVISWAFSTLFFIFAPSISYMLFGEKFLMSWVILQYSVLFIIWNFLLRVNHILLAASGRIKTRLYIVIISIAINVVLNYIFISILWVVWAALATGISWVIIWIITEYYLRDYKAKFDFLYIGKNFLYFIVSWVWLYFVFEIFFQEISRFTALLWFLGISIIYFIFLWIINKAEISIFLREIKKLRH